MLETFVYCGRPNQMFQHDEMSLFAKDPGVAGQLLRFTASREKKLPLSLARGILLAVPTNIDENIL
jgi:hypothetical protein